MACCVDCGAVPRCCVFGVFGAVGLTFVLEMLMSCRVCLRFWALLLFGVDVALGFAVA